MLLGDYSGSGGFQKCPDWPKARVILDYPVSRDVRRDVLTPVTTLVLMQRYHLRDRLELEEFRSS